MKVLLALLIASFPVATMASTYENRHAAAVKECEAIDRAKYQSGLYFNPEGYRSYYVRSQCFQQAAIRFRDVSLCRQVRQRRALFSSSWGYSPANCRALVTHATMKDRGALEATRAAYVAGHMVLRDFRLELDNNGRDFDIVPIIEGTSPHGYMLRFEIVPDDGGAPILLHSDGYFVDTTPLRIYVTRTHVRQQIPGLSTDRSYQVVANMTLSLPTTTSDAEWSEPFVESVFPLRERSQRVAKTISFPAERVIRRPGP